MASIVVDEEVSRTEAGGSAAGSAMSPYSPLDSQRKQIRLLEILPDRSPERQEKILLESEDPIRCRLEIVSLLEDPEPNYECLSYRWGDSRVAQTMELNKIEMAITKNLAAALRQFRTDQESLTGRERPRIWVDAVCINQMNVSEKEEQVAMMQEIYARAANVRMWLGAVRDSEHLARMQHGFRLLENHRALSADDLWARDDLDDMVLGAGQLFSDEYWKRRWITQEIALAKRRTLQYGSDIFEFPNAQEIASLRQLARRISQIDANTFGWKLNPELVSQFEALAECGKSMSSALAMISVAQHLVDHPNRESVELTHQLRGMECSLAHDHVYGLLGLLPRTLRIDVDYKCSWEDVYADFTVKVLQSTNHLTTLYWTPSQRKGLPSWSVDWSAKIGSDCWPAECEWDFSASRETKPRISVPQPGILALGGVIVDSVAVTASPKGSSSTATASERRGHEPRNAREAYRNDPVYRVLEDWIKLHARMCLGKQNDDDTVMTIDRGLLRTLLSDYGKLPDSAPERFAQSGRIAPDELDSFKATVDEFLATGLSAQTRLSLLRKLFVRMGRYPLFVTKNGRPGVGKSQICPGDVICVFSSAKVPYCLRPHAMEGRKSYSIISPCYVNGIMDGEAVVAAGPAESTSVGAATADVTSEDIWLA